MELSILKVDLQNPEHCLKVIKLLNDYMNDPMGNNRPMPAGLGPQIVAGLKQHSGFLGFFVMAGDQYAGLANCVSKTDLSLYHRYTAGGTLQLKNEKNPLGFLATAYYQFGKSAPTVNLDAYLLAIKGTYAFNDKIIGLLGTDYYSGSTSTLAATKTNTFNKLPYGVNHSFNGYMEYWATLPKGGLINYFGGVTLKLNKRLSSDLTFYHFRLAEDMKSGTNVIGKNIGSELDVVLNYKFSAETAVQFAWCTYFETTGTKLIKYKSATVATRFPQFAYVMLTIKPQLYKTPVVTESK